MDGDEGPVDYVRCGQADPPEERRYTAAGLTFTVAERTLQIEGKRTFRIAAFEGPVGAPLAAAQVAELTRSKPDLVFYLGNLGDDEAMANASLAALATTPLPVIFVPGGADRWPVVESAFDDLDAPLRDRLILAAGLHRIDIGPHQFAVMPGAPLGRYGVDEDACGFGPDDVTEVKEAFGEQAEASPPRWLLAWTAPSGWGLSAGIGRLEIGSPDLHILAEALSAEGGLFAYPRGEATGVRQPAGGAERWVVPRLGPEGSISAEGAYLDSGFAVLTLKPPAP